MLAESSYLLASLVELLIASVWVLRSRVNIKGCFFA